MEKDASSVILESVAEEDTVYCVCGKVGSGIMIDCDRCQDWFHTSCISYVCEKCSNGGDDVQAKSDKSKNIAKLLKEKEKDELLKKKFQEENEAAKVVIVAMDPPSNMTALQPNLLHAAPEITNIIVTNSEP